MVVYFARDDLLVSLDLFVSVERREACGHFIDEHSVRPPVNGIVVALHSQADHDEKQFP